MKFWNYYLVEEVIDFLKIFKFIILNDICYFIKIINDKEKVKYYVYEEVFGEDEYMWKDIKENEMSEVWGEIYELNDD